MSPVRRATPDDAAAIADVRRTSWQAAYGQYLPASVWDEWDAAADADRIRTRLAGGLRRSLVAELDGEVAAFVMFGPYRDDDMPAADEVYAIYARPEHWARGLGRSLLGAAVQELTRRPVLIWVLEANERARRFYEIAGFRWDGTRKPAEMPGGVQLPEIRYRLD